MEFRDSLSRLKKKVKKVKHRLTGSKSKLSETGIDVGGERVDSTSSRPSSEPHVVVGGSNDQGGKGPNADGGQILSAIRLPQLDEPSSMSERASAKNQERRGADVDGGEVEQAHSHLDSDVEVAEGSGPAGGKDIDVERVEQLAPSPSITSVLPDEKPDST